MDRQHNVTRRQILRASGSLITTMELAVKPRRFRKGMASSMAPAVIARQD